MVTHTLTKKLYEVYNPNSDLFYKVELEIDHSNFDEETISITDEFGSDVEDDITFSEVEVIWENYYNNQELFSEDE